MTNNTYRICTATIEGVSPYSQSRHYEKDKHQAGDKDEIARSNWREHCHFDANGEVNIPAMALKNALSEAAKFLQLTVPGKGKATYTKHFEAGVLITESIPIGITRDELTDERNMEALFLPSDGVRGSGKRIMKYYPRFDDWGGRAQFLVFDRTITNDIFESVLRSAGQFIGLGRFRPRNNGTYGRFTVADCAWQETAA